MKVYMIGGQAETPTATWNDCRERLQEMGHTPVSYSSILTVVDDQTFSDVERCKFLIKGMLDCDMAVLLPGFELSVFATLQKYVAKQINMRCEKIEEFGKKQSQF